MDGMLFFVAGVIATTLAAWASRKGFLKQSRERDEQTDLLIEGQDDIRRLLGAGRVGDLQPTPSGELFLDFLGQSILPSTMTPTAIRKLLEHLDGFRRAVLRAGETVTVPGSERQVAELVERVDVFRAHVVENIPSEPDYGEGLLDPFTWLKAVKKLKD